IGVTNEDVDREVQRIAQQNREPVVTVRKKLTEDGTMDRIASHIQTEKTLNFLFDKATKTVPEPGSDGAEPGEGESGEAASGSADSGAPRPRRAGGGLGTVLPVGGSRFCPAFFTPPLLKNCARRFGTRIPPGAPSNFSAAIRSV